MGIGLVEGTRVTIGREIGSVLGDPNDLALVLMFPASFAVSLIATQGVGKSSRLLGLLAFVTIMSGGFVAGLKAGFVYNTFPLMDGRWIPEAMFLQEPLWRNFFENMATVQFDHRLLATLTFLGTMAFWFIAGRTISTPQARLGMHLLLAAVVLQVTLGILILLMAVPTLLAAAHQAVALVFLTIALYLVHSLRKIPM